MDGVRSCGVRRDFLRMMEDFIVAGEGHYLRIIFAVPSENLISCFLVSADWGWVGISGSAGLLEGGLGERVIFRC